MCLSLFMRVCVQLYEFNVFISVHIKADLYTPSNRFVFVFFNLQCEVPIHKHSCINIPLSAHVGQ